MKSFTRTAVVLVQPLIHWNTGSIGRTCLGFDAELHLIRPLGFSVDSTHVKRAGLDYWSEVNLHVHDSWTDFQTKCLPEFDHTVMLSKSARRGKSYNSMQIIGSYFLVIIFRRQVFV